MYSGKGLFCYHVVADVCLCFRSLPLFSVFVFEACLCFQSLFSKPAFVFGLCFRSLPLFSSLFRLLFRRLCSGDIVQINFADVGSQMSPLVIRTHLLLQYSTIQPLPSFSVMSFNRTLCMHFTVTSLRYHTAHAFHC